MRIKTINVVEDVRLAGIVSFNHERNACRERNVAQENHRSCLADRDSHLSIDRERNALD